MAINSMSAVSHGLSGLASGMDTQSMVDAMLAGTQAKIDKSKGQQAVLGYKQAAYRQMYTSLNGLATSFFGGTSPAATRIMYSDFYNTMSAATKSNNFRVTGTGQANSGKTIVNSISQLAKAAKLTSGEAVSGKVEGELDLSELAGQTIQFQLDGVRKTIKLPGSDGTPVADAAAFHEQLQKSIDKAFGNGVTVGLDGNKITFTADTSREFLISGNAAAMKVLGMPTGISNKVNDNLRLDQINLKTPLSGDSFAFEINGEKFEFSGSDRLSSVISKINGSDANVKVRYSALEDKFVMESTVSGKNVTLNITQTSGNLMTAMFGEASGNTVTGNKQMVADPITGKLPGVAFEYNGTPLTGEEAALVNDAFAAMADEIDRLTATADYTMWMKIDGEEVGIKIPKRTQSDPDDPATMKKYTVEDVAQLINDNDEVRAATGGTDLVTLEKDTNGQVTGGITIKATPGVALELGQGFNNLLGVEKLTNMREATENDTLASLGMGDITFTFAPDPGRGNPGGTITIDSSKTLGDAAAELQTYLQTVAYTGDPAKAADIKVDFLSGDEEPKGRFRIFGVDIPMEIQVSGDGEKLFGSDKLFLNTSGTAGVRDVGQNAILKINGIEVERNSNEFTVEGLNFELVNTFNPTGEVAKEESIDVTRDVTKIFDGLSKFMEEYNKLVDQTWGKLKEDPTYRDYPPLTDKQKDSMSDKEVELWEKKSQEGLMRGDSTMMGIMDAMRRVLTNKPEGAKYGLSDLGIEVAYDMEKGIGGYLKFSNGNPPGDEKLRAMIAQEPEEIEKLFADSKTGIGVELNNVIKGVSVDTTGDKGGGSDVPYSNFSLVNLAGRPGFSDTSSSIYREMRQITENLENLNRKYKAEYNRYWKQFNTMEQTINSMNQQSSWLSQQFA